MPKARPEEADAALGEERSDQQKIASYFRSGHHLLAVTTYEEDHALDIIRAACIDENRDLWIWKATIGLRAGLFEGSKPIPDSENPAAALYHLTHQFKSTAQVCCVLTDIAAHLVESQEAPKVLRLLRDAIRHFRRKHNTIVLVDHDDKLPSVIRHEATWFDISLPDSTELEQIVRSTVRRIHKRQKLEVRLHRAELDIIIRNLRGLTRRQAEQVITDAVTEDWRLDVDDINHILARKRQLLRHAGVLEYVETPIDLSEIGGLERLKRWLKHRQLALDSKAKQRGITPPRGVLMLGVQGAGKSMCAKAIATAWKRPLLRLDPGALYDRYVGESERRLREALHQAEMMSPIVLWIDEIEKGFSSAGAASNDGGLSRRMFGTLLTWMQEHTEPVFLVATANDIEALPPELLRKGRFDEIFFVDLPDQKVRKVIFQIHLRKRGLDSERFDLKQLSTESEGFSGAEIEQAIVSALHEAYVDDRDLKTEDILSALKESPPLSVTMAERIDALRAWAATRCRPAD